MAVCNLLTDVFLSLHGVVITNNGIVDISDIGSTDDTALLCHTDILPQDGDWTAPDGTRIFASDVPGVARSRGPTFLRLKKAGTPPEGIYTCVIKTAANTFETRHVGLYNQIGTGMFVLKDITVSG